MISVQFYTLLLLILNSVVSGKNNRGYNYNPPEIIQNDPLPPSDQFGYNYPVPNPPFFDEPPPSTPNYLYGPPSLDLPHPNATLPPIQNDIPDYSSYLPPPPLQPPLFDPVPPEDDTPNNQYLPPPTLYDSPSARFRISNMSCLDSPANGYFRATMSLTRAITTLPVVDDAPADCITGSGDVYRLEIDGDRMRRCGVRFCSNGVNMCVMVRMPTVRGLKLPEDSLVMLRCRPQERVVAHTKQLRINALNSVQQARSVQPSHVVTGGSQRGFDTQVALFRRGGAGSGEFNRLVAPGSAVQLGEDLMLRAQVRDGDGWRFSRMSDINVQHVSSAGRIRQRAITLLDSAGCRDARARAVVPSDPAQPTPLVTTMQFRAFMFQGMASGDEMVMSVRMVACLQFDDCQSKTRSCGDNSRRLRRHLNTSKSSTPSNSTHNTNAFNSYIEFRVVTPESSLDIPPASHASSDNVSGTGRTIPNTKTVLQSNALSLLVVVIISFLVLVGAACLIVYLALPGRK